MVPYTKILNFDFSWIIQRPFRKTSQYISNKKNGLKTALKQPVKIENTD